MGWTGIYNITRKQLIQERTADADWTTQTGVRIQDHLLAFCVRGGNLWKVWERTRTNLDGTTETKRWIGLDLLRNGPSGEQLYKDLSETMGPCEVNCPESYLDMVPEPDREYARDWRKSVREYHATRRQSTNSAKGLQVGDLVSCNGYRSSPYRVVALRGQRILAVGTDGDGVHYRIPRTRITGVTKST